MPRVSADHLAARRQQVLDAALRCFARQGFHATSVRDVVRESGLSAGAVYSYFPSKDELVAGAVAPMLEAMARALDDVVHDPAPAPAEVVAGLLRRVVPVAVGGEVDMTRVAVTAWGEALRDDVVRGLADRTYGRIRGRLVEAVAAWRDAGNLPAGTDPEPLAQVLFSTVAGFVLQHALFADVDVEPYAEALALLLPSAGSPAPAAAAG